MTTGGREEIQRECLLFDGMGEGWLQVTVKNQRLLIHFFLSPSLRKSQERLPVEWTDRKPNGKQGQEAEDEYLQMSRALKDQLSTEPPALSCWPGEGR